MAQKFNQSGLQPLHNQGSGVQGACAHPNLAEIHSDLNVVIALLFRGVNPIQLL